MVEYQEDPDVVFFERPGYPMQLRAEKKDKKGGIHWAQVYIHTPDEAAIEYAKRQLTIFIHEQEKEAK